MSVSTYRVPEPFCVCVFHCMITKFQGGIFWGKDREIFKRKEY